MVGVNTVARFNRLLIGFLEFVANTLIKNLECVALRAAAQYTLYRLGCIATISFLNQMVSYYIYYHVSLYQLYTGKNIIRIKGSLIISIKVNF